MKKLSLESFVRHTTNKLNNNGEWYVLAEETERGYNVYIQCDLEVEGDIVATEIYAFKHLNVRTYTDIIIRLQRVIKSVNGKMVNGYGYYNGYKFKSFISRQQAA